jgi:hypothetical protein
MAHARLPLTRKSQWDHLRQMVMKILGIFLLVSLFLFGLNLLIGTCVRVNDHVFALLRRLNLIYFRWYAPFTSFLDSTNIETF